MKATVGARGQVVIPKPLRDRLGIVPGEVLEFSEDGGRLVAAKTLGRDLFAGVYGILRGLGEGRTTDEIIEDLRGPVDAV
jgi:antitoxin PrlF